MQPKGPRRPPSCAANVLFETPGCRAQAPNAPAPSTKKRAQDLGCRTSDTLVNLGGLHAHFACAECSRCMCPAAFTRRACDGVSMLAKEHICRRLKLQLFLGGAGGTFWLQFQKAHALLPIAFSWSTPQNTPKSLRRQLADARKGHPRSPSALRAETDRGNGATPCRRPEIIPEPLDTLH